ncbi:hypothetical protein BRD00_01300 [Halobacteriales archaeon QS_8_69_26]|nr:MAG: hypothetical protein BRD00_01300 [Halobacteriales archaeon QS_8_69_26]
METLDHRLTLSDSLLNVCKSFFILLKSFLILFEPLFRVLSCCLDIVVSVVECGLHERVDLCKFRILSTKLLNFVLDLLQLRLERFNLFL